MIDKKTILKLPPEYDYTAAEWNINLKADIYHNKRKTIIFSYIFAIMVPSSFLLSDLFHGQYDALLNYLLPLVILISILFYALKSRNSESVINITMTVAFAGFFLSVYLPYNRQMSLFILLTFVPFAYHLTGKQSGIIWSALFFISVTVSYMLSYYKILPPWELLFLENQATMIVLSIMITFFMLLNWQKQSENHLRKLIKHLVFDYTTGLPNKNTMLKSYPEKQDFILAIVHIQNFSELSSLFGYEIAEKILLFAARTISEISERDGYRCYKLLGHEFGIIIPKKNMVINKKNTEVILNALWFELQSIKLFEGEKEYCPSYKIGATIVYYGNTEKALSRADIALNMANRFFHNYYIFDEFADDRLKVIKSSNEYSVLIDNIKNHYLKIVYQPIVKTTSSEIRWYEALMRIRQKDGTYESIYKYLHMARYTGLYNELTKFLLKNVRTMLLTTGHDISINITLSDITHPGFMEEIISICDSIKNRPNKLILEIIESEELVEIDFCRNFIKTIQGLGCKVALDDFGSGYSNFCTLFNLSVDIVKIDGSLMKSVEFDKNALHMIESITSFCHKSGKVIVAEYIENDILHQVAQNYNIHYCQGYHFGKPDEFLPVN
jgi:EAL domain-containing protein (putative c-di-GMP-specific phosphodiesterase class I)/GGDEF domain-containing protein